MRVPPSTARGRGTAWSGASAELAEDLVGIGEPPGLVLRVDALPVDTYVEDAAVALEELRLYAEGFLDAGRQPGGLGAIVSAYAVGDGDLHGCRSGRLL
jgi:hypothetical protein